MKFFNVAKRFGRKIAAGVGGSMLLADAALAQTTGMDVSGVVTDIGYGVTAIGTIGVAWVGFVYLKKAWNKL